MKTISIITVVYNAEDTIEDCIGSVLKQTCTNVEYIVVDGKSNDATLGIIEKYKDRIALVISEEDNGIYDAMNKGIRQATGSLVGILNADDYYPNPEVLADVVRTAETERADCYYFDLIYEDYSGRRIRTWKPGAYRNGLFSKGWVPPHPAFFIRRQCFDKYGYYDTDFKIAADYDMMFRLLKVNQVKSAYRPLQVVNMRVGGESNKSIRNIIRGNLEIRRTWKKYGYRQRLLRFNVSKLFHKGRQFFTS
jgi:glycosyltransferase involved in cell wall biosynthesis